MDNLCTCIYCNRMFIKTRNVPVCNSCDDILISKIKEFLNEHKASTIKEISEGTGISVKVIKAYMQSGVLTEVLGDINLCISCGEIIGAGSKYCASCLKKMKVLEEFNTFNSQSSNTFEKTKKREGMHFIDKDKIGRPR